MVSLESNSESYYIVGPQAGGYLNEWLKMDSVDGEKYQIYLPAPVINKIILDGEGSPFIYEMFTKEIVKNKCISAKKDAIKKLNSYFKSLTFSVISSSNIKSFYHNGVLDPIPFESYKNLVIFPKSVKGQNCGNVVTLDATSSYGTFGNASDNPSVWSFFPEFSFVPFTDDDVEIKPGFLNYSYHLTSSGQKKLDEYKSILKNASQDGAYKFMICPKSKTWSIEYLPGTHISYMVATNAELNASSTKESRYDYDGYNILNEGSESHPFNALMTYSFAGTSNELKHNNVYCTKAYDYLFLKEENGSLQTYRSTYNGREDGLKEHYLESNEIAFDDNKVKFTTAGAINFKFGSGTYNDVTWTWDSNTDKIDFTSTNSEDKSGISYSSIYVVPVGEEVNPAVRQLSAVQPKDDKNGIKLECISPEKYQADIDVVAPIKGQTNSNIFKNGLLYFKGFDVHGNELNNFVYVLKDQNDLTKNPLSASPIELKETNQGKHLNNTNQGVFDYKKAFGNLDTYTGTVRICFYVKQGKELGQAPSYSFSIDLLDKIDEPASTSPNQNGFPIPKYALETSKHEVYSTVYMRTWCGAQNYKVPDGMKAYVASKFDIVGEDGPHNTPRANTTLSQIPYIPAKTGVVLYMDEATIQEAIDKLKDELNNTNDEAKKKALDSRLGILEAYQDDYEDQDNLYFNFNASSRLKSVKLSEKTRVESLDNYLVGNNSDNYIYPSTSDYFNNDHDLIMYRNFAFTQWSKCKSFNNEDDYLGFFRVAKGCKIGKNKAYLRVPIGTVGEGQYVRVSSYSPSDFDKSAQAKGIMLIFDDMEEDDNIVSGIKDITKDVSVEDDYYTLTGIKVAHPTKGLYIHNGKKVLMK